MKIAMIGCRGIPAGEGGIERVVEELSAALAARGHEVTVFCRSRYSSKDLSSYRGVDLRRFPAVPTKHLEAVSHTAISTGAALRGFDVLHYHAIGPGMLAVVPKLIARSSAVVQSVHGLDAQRQKWGPVAQRVLRLGERMSSRVPDAVIVPSQALVEHYWCRYGRRAVLVPHPWRAVTKRPVDAIKRQFGLSAQRYVLFVGRLVPEKRVELLLDAFRRIPNDIALVVAGGSGFTDAYVARLRRAAGLDPRVRMVGPVHGALLEELYSNAVAFVSPSSLEGMPMVLLEAISAGLPIVATAIAPHVEVLGAERPGIRIVPPGDGAALARGIAQVIDDGPQGRAEVERLRSRIVERHSPDRSAEATEAVYHAALAARRPAPAAAPR